MPSHTEEMWHMAHFLSVQEKEARAQKRRREMSLLILVYENVGVNCFLSKGNLISVNFGY